MPKTIKHEVTINAEPQAVYEALMDTRRHKKFTGADAKVSKRVGGEVSAYDGYIKAINVELVPGKRIVQAWRLKEFGKGIWSIATFDLKKARGKKTTLNFKQYGVPDEHFSPMNKGWREEYWNKLNTYFANKKR
jgi:uncharacterized protein YndB with AHSA1/START domain